MTRGTYLAGAMPEHNLLLPYYWHDCVSYEGKTVPSGTIGCEVLKSVVVPFELEALGK